MHITKSDERVVQQLLDFADDNAFVLRPIDNHQFMMQNQQIDRWDRENISNQYIKKLSIDHFRSQKSCELGRYKEKEPPIVIKDIEQKPLIESRKSCQKGFIKKILPRLEYLPLCKTFTPSLDQPLVYHIDKPVRAKVKFGRSKSNNTHVRASSSNATWVINTSPLNMRLALAFLSNKKTRNSKTPNYSFDIDNAKKINQNSTEEKKEQKQVDQMKNQVLLRRIKYQSNFEKEVEQRASLCREKLLMDSQLMHNFRTKKFVRNKKQWLVM